MGKLKHASTVLSIGFTCVVTVIGCFYGVVAFFFHSPEYKKEIAALNKEVRTTSTLNLDLMRVNDELRRYCRWAAVLEPVLGPESRKSMDSVDKRIRE